MEVQRVYPKPSPGVLLKAGTILKSGSRVYFSLIQNLVLYFIELSRILVTIEPFVFID